MLRVGEQLSKEVKITSHVPQGSVSSPLLFLVYVCVFRETSTRILDYSLMTGYFVGTLFIKMT